MSSVSDAPSVHLHRSPAMFPTRDVVRWSPTLVGVPQNWRTNLRYEPGHAVITVHGDEDGAAPDVARLVALASALGTAVIDVYLPEATGPAVA